MTVRHQTLVELLRDSSERFGAHKFSFLADGTQVSDTLSLRELDRKARSVAAQLQVSGICPGDRVLLLYPPGLEFLSALFGCFYAGAIAVPSYAPRGGRENRTLTRLRATVGDSRPACVLAAKEVATSASSIFKNLPELEKLKWLVTTDNTIDAELWRPTELRGDDLALLQYTSGSTREPRGVMLSHQNLLVTQQMIYDARGHREGDVLVTWLPVTHDMGLIGKMLQPIFSPCDCVVIPPLQFFQSPHKWLDAISTHRGTGIAAPNFAYEMCVRKISDEQMASLDLSSVRVAMSGAEPVRDTTLDAFARRFERCGFDRRAFLPCYGLAEASLMVSGKLRDTGPEILAVDDQLLRKRRAIRSSKSDARRLVSCGPPVGGQEVAIVGDNGAAVSAGGVGELWVRGPNVARGYWENEEQTRATFGAHLADGRGPYLRTGDLGFVDERGELFIVGREKDVIKVRGLNYFAQDIEATVEDVYPDIRQGCSAAFAIETPEGEGAALVCEYGARRAPDDGWAAFANAVRGAVTAEHEINLRQLTFVSAAQVPKTPSGKVMRGQTRTLLSENRLKVLHQQLFQQGPDALVASDGPPLRTQDEIASFMSSWLSEHMKTTVGRDADFGSLGVDSLDVVRMMEALGDRVGAELSASLVLSHGSIEELAAHISDQVAE